MRKRLRLAHLAGGLAAAAIPSQSRAQAVGPTSADTTIGADHVTPPQATAPTKKAAAAETTPDAGSQHSEEITVTATRRASSISKVPLSVSAYSQQTLDMKGARTIEDVVRFTPGVAFDPITNNISIRGIDSEAGAGTTGIYIDDTPVQIRNLGFNAENSLPELFDLDRVEVLRGPQGTLFGAGSEGGTVRYITPQPGLEAYSAYVRSDVAASADGSPDYEFGAALGGPLIKDKLAFRVSVSHETDGGYLDHLNYRTNDITDTNTNSNNVNVYRAALAAVPVDGLTLTPSFLYQQRLHADTDDYFEGLSDPASGVYRTNEPERIQDNDRFYLPALNVRYDLGPVSFISNTSYLHRDNLTGYQGTDYNLSFYNTYLDDSSPYYPLLLPTGLNPLLPDYVSPSRITNRQRNFTQEFRLQSDNPLDRFVWTIGGFYSHNEQLSSEQIEDPVANTLFLPVFGDTIEDFFGAPLYGKDSYINQTSSTDEQLAAFANGTVRIWHGIKFDAGLRYAHTHYSFTNFADGSQNGGLTQGSGGQSDNPLTPKFTLSWQIDPRDMIYASWAKGFREGGANAPVPAEACAQDFANFGITQAPDKYSSDSVKSWEIGTKNRLLDDRLELGLSAYTINWDNIQQNILLPICGIQYTGNLGKAISRGFDAQALIRPMPGMTIDTAFGFTDAHYTTDSNASSNGNSGGLVARAGDTLGNPGTSGEPDWKVSVGVQYNVPRDLFTILGGRPYARADYQYTGPPKGTETFRDPLTASYDPGYARTAASNYVSLRAGLLLGRGYNLSVFVNNLFNATPRLTQFHETYGSELYTDSTLRPRYVGLMLTYRE